jgi:hypothetical protein
MHQIKNQLSHPNLHRNYIQGDVLHSIAKAIHQSPSPIHFHRVKSHAGIISNEYADALARNQSQPTLMLRMPPSKQLVLREILSTSYTGLQKNMKNTKPYKITQAQTSHLPQGSGTYPITMTPCKHNAPPPQTRKCQHHSKLS